MITLSLDVTKIPRDKIIPGKKQRPDGSVGKYVNLVLFANRDGRDQYGNDGAVCLSQSKEEREAKTPKVYLGNYKESDSAPRQSATSQREDAHLKDKSNGFSPAEQTQGDVEDLPF